LDEIWKICFISKSDDGDMSKSLLVIIAVIVGAASVFAVSPYFTESTVDEALPTGAIMQPKMEDKDAMMIKDDSTMIEEESIMEDKMMEETMEEKESMMEKDDSMMEETIEELVVVSYAGTFTGAGDGIHDAQGDAYTIPLEDGSNVLRLENFKSTNGPDLFVYLATDENASEFINLGVLKANNGNQNYQIPDDTDLDKYNKVLIWCKSFSVLFGSAELSS